MNAYTNQSSPNASVLEEAADWVDRFDSLCEAEHRAFTEWLEIEQNKNVGFFGENPIFHESKNWSGV